MCVLPNLKILEAFGSGTAVIVSPIEEFTVNDETFKIPINPKLNSGELTHRISALIQNIQVRPITLLDPASNCLWYVSDCLFVSFI